MSIDPNQGKTNFRLFITRFRLYFPHVFPIKLLLMASLIWSPAYADAAPAKSANKSAPVKKQSARQQVHAIVMAQAQSDLEDAAKRYNWRDYTIKMNVFIPSDISNYKACPSALGISLPSGNRANYSRLRYDIACNDGESWSVSVTVKPDIYMPIVMSKNMVPMGQKLTPSDIELKRYNISNARNGYIVNPDEVIGLTAKRRIRPLQVLTPSQLDSPILVTRGQTVVMIAELNGIEAKTLGQAMKQGRKGDLIQIKNLSSNKVVSAVVDQAGVVRVSYALGH